MFFDHGAANATRLVIWLSGSTTNLPGNVPLLFRLARFVLCLGNIRVWPVAKLAHRPRCTGKDFPTLKISKSQGFQGMLPE